MCWLRAGVLRADGNQRLLKALDRRVLQGPLAAEDRAQRQHGQEAAQGLRLGRQ